jgi:hypothetical protein
VPVEPVRGESGQKCPGVAAGSGWQPQLNSRPRLAAVDNLEAHNVMSVTLKHCLDSGVLISIGGVVAMTSRTSISGRWRSCAAALIAASLLSVTACTGGEAPPGGSPAPESPSFSAMSTPNATPTPTASYKPADASGRAQNVPVPVLPEAAKAETKEDSIAFAKHWYALLNYAYQTGEFRPMDDVTDSSCRLCSKVRPGILEWNSEGRWIAGGQVEVKGAFTEFVKTNQGNYQVTTQLEQSSGVLYRADSSVEKSVPASQVLADIMTIRFADGHWKMIDVDRLGA